MRGVSFNGHHCAEWGCIMSACKIGVATAKTITVDVPGTDGVLDLSTALDGNIHYNNRKITIELRATNKKTKEWADLLYTVEQAVNGKRVQVKFDDDAEHYWMGRAEVQDFDAMSVKKEITIVIDADPKRY